ncbi:thioredoxin family protein [Sulfurimonas sp. MAG313]|nr:thioredoxin family protein [Sulfurimonas sp. MAG313]MDF1881832.1 thioredoxin family protein [Sulfurimonas sp. MAG313]
MKLLLLVLITMVSLGASEISEFAQTMGYETSYKVAIQKAKQSNKEVMFVMVTNYCPWCRKFEKRTLVKEKVNLIVHKKYIPLILNREKGNYPKQFYTKRIPVVMFINPNNEEKIKESLGYKKVKDFVIELNK